MFRSTSFCLSMTSGVRSPARCSETILPAVVITLVNYYSSAALSERTDYGDFYAADPHGQVVTLQTNKNSSLKGQRSPFMCIFSLLLFNSCTRKNAQISNFTEFHLSKRFPLACILIELDFCVSKNMFLVFSLHNTVHYTVKWFKFHVPELLDHF